MHMHSLNWLAILAAAISTMILGFLWYSPLLFGKAWAREMGYDLKDKAKMDEMRKSYCYWVAAQRRSLLWAATRFRDVC